MAEEAETGPKRRPDGLWDVGPATAVADDQLVGVELDGQKVLLARSGGLILAVAGTCPHAGAPLAEGVRCGDRVICPWHKASFDLRSGAVVEPPAVDALPHYPTRIEAGRIIVSLQAMPAPEPQAAHDDRCFVILGAGAAGQSAAQTLREEGFGGRLVMVSHEAELPYDRTVLSKYKLSGEPGAEKSPLHEAEFYERHRIERRRAEIVEVDATSATVHFADGTSLTYDAALLATGGIPKTPKRPGIGLRGVFVLRTAADADAILAAAKQAKRAVVVGAGFISMEVAASLRERGLEVTVVMPGATPFEKPLGPTIGAVFARLHQKQGIVLRAREEVAAFEGDSAVTAVRLVSGEHLPADLVVIGGGISPATGMLRGVTLREDGGVPVDRHLRAADRLWAAGDVAAFPLYGDGEPIRVEHWRVAQQHGRHAALGMLGREAPYVSVPVFWTIHFLKRLDYVGHAREWDDIVVDGDLEKPEFIALYVKAGRVDAVIGWDRDKDVARAICLFEERREWQSGPFLAALAEGR
ncbi:FAD-dependent oxidoreductase [Acidisoma sp.]|uniref:FAD-dependent oxidoreductase n=1 Tax=Acidisoma sp. TaxID=1872115 RepID=UPI003AFFD1F1